MIVDRKTLLMFRLISGVIVIIGLALAFFISKWIGGLILAIGIFFLFTPYKKDDII